MAVKRFNRMHADPPALIERVSRICLCRMCVVDGGKCVHPYCSQAIV